MAENSRIEWTDHTFNPWTGCTKVSQACDHCYAESWAKRSGHVEWGPHGERRRTRPATWAMPRKWNAQAEAEGRRFRVFCASLADVFDNHRSILPEWRADLWRLIHETPCLDWLLLTKRPQNIARFLPDGWGGGWSNVWLGTTVENQEEADRRIPVLLGVPARIRFLSCEPLLERVDLKGWIWPGWDGDIRRAKPAPHIAWVIAGGESGPGARPMHPEWARSLRDQCRAARTPFHFKQWGDWHADALLYTTPQGENPPPRMRVGKKAAGRHLDGRTWDEVPA